MTREEKLDLIKKTIQKYTNNEIQNFSVDTKLSDLDLDSLDIVEIQMEFEEVLGHDLPDPSQDKPINSVGDLLAIME